MQQFLSAAKRKELAGHVTKEVFAQFSLPKVIGYDNGPVFMVEVSQGLARTLGIDWK